MAAVVFTTPDADKPIPTQRVGRLSEIRQNRQVPRHGGSGAVRCCLFLLFAGGGFYFSDPVIGCSRLGLILLACFIIWVMDGFHTKP